MENQTITPPDNIPTQSLPADIEAGSGQPRSNIFVPVVLTILVCGGVFGFGGYYLGSQNRMTRQVADDRRYAPVPTDTITATPSPLPSVPNISTSAKVGLKKYTSSLEKLSFDYPANWRPVNTKTGSNDPNGDVLDIQDPSGKVTVSWVSAIDGLGGSCDPNIPFTQSEGELGAPCASYEVVEKQKLAGADLYYVAYLVTRDGVTYEPTFALQAPNGLLTTKRTLAYLLFTGKNNGKINAGLTGKGPSSSSKEEARTFFSTPEATQAKYILLSATY